MYKVVKTDEFEPGQSGLNNTPVMTLADEYGGRCQIVIDDHCYVLKLLDSDGKYKTTDHIFPEAFEAMKSLPSPNSRNAVWLTHE